MTQLVLGIETSCDETAAAVVGDDGAVLSDVIHTQVGLHAGYGGVVPELASRDHMNNVGPVVSAALEQAGVRVDDLAGLAVTNRPGLSGALLVGVQAAQGIAWAADKPLVGVDHLVGHLLAVYLRHPGAAPAPAPTPPFIALVASGGHTALYRVDALDLGGVHELGATRDDAAGEAFDKFAKLLGLGYPGGPVVDRLAHEGDPTAVTLARPMTRRDSLEFSFSGLKTDVTRWLAQHGRPGDGPALRDLCAAFQTRVVDTLLGKSVRAAQREGLDTVVIAGGVSANRQLRERAAELGARGLVRFVVPPLRSCTDNAAMIAYAGRLRLLRGENESGRLRMHPRTALPRVTRKGRGAR